MNWFNFFETKSQFRHSFGRGINANLSEKEEEFFNKSYKAFEKKDIFKAYKFFFKSLENFSNDESNKNITYTQNDDSLDFEIFQGTAKIVGKITQKSLYAEVTMIKKSCAHIALKRYILERNYQFTYAYYFLDDEYIKLKIFQDNISMSPQRVFYPLREIALNADFDKEYMRSEFPEIVLEDISHVEDLEENELKVKYDFLMRWIQELENKISLLPSSDNTGMQSFEYLLIFFKIDYLLVPKYEMYQKISKKVQEYFSNETSTVHAKNEELKSYIEVLKDMSYEEFSTKFYNSKYTFNPTDNTSKEEINTFIDEALIKIRWYKNNRYNQIIPSIYEYIAFYLLYNYGLNSVTKDLLHTLIEIQNPEFFDALEYTLLYDKKSETFSKRNIISRIEGIIEPYKERYKYLKPFGESLNYTSLNEFSNSFYVQIKHLNFEEV